MFPHLSEHASVLFVDDDKIIQKLFCRSVKRLKPEWKGEEASCGEEALDRVDTADFDLIFVDHYLSTTTEKMLLGPEAIVELRR